jgi:hypothetical protein
METEMGIVSKITDRNLIWVQVGSSKREFELRGELGVLGNLKFHRLFGPRASAVTADGEWLLKKSGFFRPRVVVRDIKSGKDIAKFSLHWTGSGILEFNTGFTLVWVSHKYFRSQWAFKDQNKEEIVHFHSRPGPMKISVEVEISKNVPEISLLACLGMYLLMLMHEDKAAEVTTLIPLLVSDD